MSNHSGEKEMRENVLFKPNSKVTSLWTQRSCSKRGKSHKNWLVTGALLFSSPRHALRTKCCVHLTCLIKRLLCRLFYRLSVFKYGRADTIQIRHVWTRKWKTNLAITDFPGFFSRFCAKVVPNTGLRRDAHRSPICVWHHFCATTTKKTWKVCNR